MRLGIQLGLVRYRFLHLLFDKSLLSRAAHEEVDLVRARAVYWSGSSAVLGRGLLADSLQRVVDTVNLLLMPSNNKLLMLLQLVQLWLDIELAHMLVFQIDNLRLTSTSVAVSDDIDGVVAGTPGDLARHRLVLRPPHVPARGSVRVMLGLVLGQRLECTAIFQ